VLVRPTDASGKIVSSGTFAFGPYLKEPPKNPLNGSWKVAPTGQPTPDAGWTYDAKNHELKLVVPAELGETFVGGDAEVVRQMARVE
jgi:hypothetical protein